ncbi:50S ribosomal protein L20 [Engelhardtia mirabilis]|uniref:Large ribosomal subunit protein bL20 n=1 Tax=Engelhardtia mirabilis TaxID=2528011 RepID=A0A518BK54_9BACT|nr:50S ribosomal protein L20 [Planctomycetes bacterium Pla133]QDV01682.1 50S ribosomal protein L20 [Planctomycetes bacterium Pla86]
MVRVTYGAPRRQKKRRYFKQAKGFRGGRRKLWRTVRETLLRSWAYAFRDRKQRKRQFRRLWILRINAAARQRGITYSRFINGLKASQIDLNRKQLSELAIHDPAAFDTLVEKAKAACGS